ncbi:MAG: hypothetical protein WD065_22470 [Planctomycetaceae bacterium]
MHNDTETSEIVPALNATSRRRGFFATLNRHYIAVIVIFEVFIVACFIVWHVMQNVQAENTAIRILNGDQEVEITKIVFYSGMRQYVVCDNEEVCAYLSQMMRQSLLWKDQTHGDYSPYHIGLTFSNEHFFSCSTDVDARGISLSIPSADPIEPGIPTHTVFLRDDIPLKVQQIWDFILMHRSEKDRDLLIVPKTGEPYTSRGNE